MRRQNSWQLEQRSGRPLSSLRKFVLGRYPFCISRRRQILVLSNHEGISKRSMSKFNSDLGNLNIDRHGMVKERRKSDNPGRSSDFNTLSIHFIYTYQTPMSNNINNIKKRMTPPSPKIFFLLRLLAALIIQQVLLDGFLCKEDFTSVWLNTSS